MNRFISLLTFIPLLPLALLIFAGFALYRWAICCILQHRHGERFVGLLDGADAIWGIDENINCGVVNIVTFVDKSSLDCPSVTPQQILQVLRQRFKEAQRVKGTQFRKAILRRNRAFGYQFWTDELKLGVCDYIRFMEQTALSAGKHHLSDTELKEIVSELSTENLPADHSASWEILVGTQTVVDANGTVPKYPILLRFHHSLGDGISILRFVLDEIANETEKCSIFLIPEKHDRMDLKRTIQVRLKAAVDLPYYLMRVLLQKEDQHYLQKISLTSSKVVCWQNESNVLNKPRWLKLVQSVKNITGKTPYSCIFLAALSGTLHKKFRQKEQIPNNITIAMPMRMKHEEPIARLENSFATPMQKLPILQEVQLSDPCRREKLISKLSIMRESTMTLRSSSDVLITYLIMRMLPAIFPLGILRFLSKQFSISTSVSVMPGLPNKLKIGAFELHDLIYWPPAFGVVGVNVTIFSYAEELQLALIADRTILSSVQEGNELLYEIMKEIERMEFVLSEKK